MRKHNILPGMILILIAIVMMGSAMGLIPDVPWFKLLCGSVLAVWAVKALVKRDFFGTFMSVSIIAWIFENELNIEQLAPFPLLVAAALVGIGLNMIFGKKPVVQVNYSNGRVEAATVDDLRSEEWQDGRVVVLENSFNSTSKYVNSDAFRSATLENNFGSANVYFDNAVIAGQEATIDLENNFGRMNIYLPSKWRASIRQDSSFGHVRVYGEPNHDMDAPCVIIKAESNFGDLNIFFN